MLCKRCMNIMRSGTTYESNSRNGKPYSRRFYECKKCHDKFYIKEPNSQEYMNKALEKCRKNFREVYQHGTDISYILCK